MRKPHWALLVLLIGVAVHVDWHFGRPAHIRHSLAWEQHWIFGLVLGSCVACLLSWRGTTRPLARFLVVAAAGFIAGQIIEPAFEVLIYDDLSFSSVYPAVRWVLFLEFAAAFLLGGVACLAVPRLRRGSASAAKPA